MLRDTRCDAFQPLACPFDAGDTGSYKAQWITKGGVTPSQQSEAYAKIGLRYPLNEYRACFKMAGQPLVQRSATRICRLSRRAWRETKAST